MPRTDEPDDRGQSATTNGAARSLKRYGPFVAVAAVVVGAIVVFGGGGGSDDEADPAAPVETDGDALIRSGPMTPAKAALLGEDVDFGPSCDTTTERIKLPTLLAPPCVEPFTGDNGGETSPGVTAEEILIVRYEADPTSDLTATAMLESGGADIDPAAITEAMDDYLRLYNSLFETYGRTVRLETFTATSAEPDGQRADAIAIADKKPFAVLAGNVSETFARELTARKIICAPGCVNGFNDTVMGEVQPYIWQTTPTSNQMVEITAELVEKVAGPDGKAERAGSDELRSQDRVYGLLHYNTPDGTHTEAFERFTEALDDRGIDIAAESEFELDIPRGQEISRTLVAQMEEKGVTTVIYYGDPLTPTFLTKEATAQEYFPEWIIGPNVGLDTTYFGRLMDQEQWKNSFGISVLPARGALSTADQIRIYEWAFGEEPPNSLVLIAEPPLRALMTGIHLAGPNLTPETFRDAMFRYPPSGGLPTQAKLSWGQHDVWPDVDYGGTDDIGLIWWDPEASGPDELSTTGAGMYRYAKGGQRYELGALPESFEDAGLFDDASSVTVYDDLPEEQRAPEYPPPDF